MQNYIVYVHGARVQRLRRHGLPDHPEPTGAADRHFNQLVYALQWPPAYPDCPDLHVLRHWQRVMGVRHGGGRADGRDCAGGRHDPLVQPPVGRYGTQGGELILLPGAASLPGPPGGAGIGAVHLRQDAVRPGPCGSGGRPGGAADLAGSQCGYRRAEHPAAPGWCPSAPGDADGPGWLYPAGFPAGVPG